MDWNPSIGKYSTIYPLYGINKDKNAACNL